MSSPYPLLLLLLLLAPPPPTTTAQPHTEQAPKSAQETPPKPPQQSQQPSVMNRFMSDHDLDRPAQLVAAPLVPVQRLVPHNNNQPQQQQQQQVLEHRKPTPLPAATEPNAEQLEEGDIIGRPGQPSQRYRLLKLMGRIGQAGAVPLLPHPAVSTTSSSMELNVPPLPRAAAPPPSHSDQCSDVPVQIDGEPRPEPGAAGDPHAEFVHPKWRLQSKVDSGGHGEVWWAVHEGAYDDDDDDDDLANTTTTNTVYSHYVLKRVFVGTTCTCRHCGCGW